MYNSTNLFVKTSSEEELENIIAVHKNQLLDTFGLRYSDWEMILHKLKIINHKPLEEFQSKDSSVPLVELLGFNFYFENLKRLRQEREIFLPQEGEVNYKVYYSYNNEGSPTPLLRGESLLNLEKEAKLLYELREGKVSFEMKNYLLSDWENNRYSKGIQNKKYYQRFIVNSLIKFASKEEKEKIQSKQKSIYSLKVEFEFFWLQKSFYHRQPISGKTIAEYAAFENEQIQSFLNHKPSIEVISVLNPLVFGIYKFSSLEFNRLKEEIYKLDQKTPLYTGFSNRFFNLNHPAYKLYSKQLSNPPKEFIEDFEAESFVRYYNWLSDLEEVKIPKYFESPDKIIIRLGVNKEQFIIKLFQGLRNELSEKALFNEPFIDLGFSFDEFTAHFEGGSFSKIPWQGTEQQLVYLIELLVKEGYLPSGYANNNQFLITHFLNKKGNDITKEKLKVTRNRMRNNLSTKAKHVDKLLPHLIPSKKI